jgi:signal transduction histidine kinase
VVFWPLDRMLLPDGHPHVAILDQLRAVCLALTVAQFFALWSIRRYRRAPLLATAIPVSITAPIAVAIAGADFFAPDLPWVYGIYILPLTYLLIIVPLAQRIAVTIGSLLPWVVVVLWASADLSPMYRYTIISYLMFVCGGALAVGHAIYQVFYRGFRDRQELRALNTEFVRVNSQLETLTHSLEDRVSEKTSELRDLAEHISTLRETDRETIARDLHDEFGQIVAGMRLELDLAESTPAASAQHLGRLDDLVTRLHSSLRRTLGQLRPQVLDDLGLPAALEWLAESVEKRGRIAVNLALPENAEELDQRVELALFRIAQESLTNVVRHAHAELVEIELSTHSDSVELFVRDDGIGIENSPKSNSNSMGLRGMFERARALRGTLDVEPREHSSGTVVHVKLPLQPLPDSNEQSTPHERWRERT